MIHGSVDVSQPAPVMKGMMPCSSNAGKARCIRKNRIRKIMTIAEYAAVVETPKKIRSAN
jgi:hypothetical protein